MPPRPAPSSRQHTPRDARTLAQHCLEQVLLQGADVQAALDAQLRSARLPARDAGLATELTYGYLRLRLRCDFLVERHLRKPKGTPPGLRILLGQCAYALIALERVPAYATVDWGVSAVRKRFGPQLSRLANAVLRRVAEDSESGAREPDFFRLPKDSETAFLSRYYSCPAWIVELWRTSLGPEAALLLLQAQAEAPPLGLRLHRGHAGFAELAARLESQDSLLLASPPGYALQGAQELADLAELEQAGALSRQSLASLQALQELGALSAEPWPGPVWDACCGHGGKSCALMEAGAEVWCSDRSLRRLKGLRRELRRLQLPPTPVFLADATRPPLRTAPRTILVDAPCSGLGVLARRPDAKWRRSEADCRQLAGLQARILDAAAALLPRGGRLCYLTCTLHPAENEDQVARLLRENGGLRVLREWRTPADSPLREFFFGVLLGR